jgi:uncharacterized protein (DUF58 family)
MATVDAPLLSPQLLAQLEKLELVSRKIFRGRMKGERRSKRKGQSVEFADYRNYVIGDDLRFIDWNSFARLDRLYLKLFLEEEDLRFYLLVDTSASMEFGTPTKLAYAKQLAASLAFVGLVRGDQVRIETLDQTVRQRSHVWRGRHNVWRMCEQLQTLPTGASTTLTAGVKNFCLRNPGKGVVIFISDLMEKSGFEQGLRWLVAQQMDAYVVHVLSQEELDPDVQGDLRLVDCEDDDVAEVSVSSALLSRYRKNLAAFLGGAKDFCTRRGMTYLTTSTQVPVDQLIGTYLRKGGLVR